MPHSLAHNSKSKLEYFFRVSGHCTFRQPLYVMRSTAQAVVTQHILVLRSILHVLHTQALTTLLRCHSSGKDSSYEAQFYHPDDKKCVSIGLFHFKTAEEMAASEEEAARALDRVAFKFYEEKGWEHGRIQSKLSVRAC